MAWLVLTSRLTVGPTHLTTATYSTYVLQKRPSSEWWVGAQLLVEVVGMELVTAACYNIWLAYTLEGFDGQRLREHDD